MVAVSDVTVGEVAKLRELFDPSKSKNKAVTLPVTTSYAKINAFGKDRVAERFAIGQMRVDIAMDIGVPQQHFRSWWNDNFDAAQNDVLKELHAEACMFKSVRVLDVTPRNPAHAAVLKEFSMRNKELAERVDPSAWGAAKPSAPPAPSFTLNIDATVPGLEHLQAGGSITIDAVAGEVVEDTSIGWHRDEEKKAEESTEETDDYLSFLDKG